MEGILILTEAGTSVGYGHLTRCLAIAQELGPGVALLVHPDSDLAVQDGVRYFAWRDDPSALTRVSPGERTSVILVDSYRANREALQLLRHVAPFLAVIDDYNRTHYPCDLVINPAVQGPDLSAQTARVVSGAEYVILRREIRTHPRRTQHSALKNLLISFGGADRIRLFPRLLPVLARAGAKLVVLSGSDERAAELRTCFSSDQFKVFGRLGAAQVAKQFTSADLVISAGGQTLNELAYLGVPFIAVETGADQHWNIASYVDAGVTPRHYRADDPHLESELLAQIESLRNPVAREEMASRGQRLIDGQGAQRIGCLLRDRVATVSYPSG